MRFNGVTPPTGGRCGDHNFKEYHMKKIAFAIAGATALTLAACSAEKDQEDMVEEQTDAQVESLEEQADQADAMGNEAMEDSLEAQAEQVEDQGEVAEENAEDADGDVL